MKTFQLNRQAARRGLTLIELVVVLAVLVALAGLIIGNFPGIIRKASHSSSATSVQDISRSMQYFYTTTLKYPTGFDSLLDASGVYAKLPPTSTNPAVVVGGQLTASTVTANEAAALSQLGVNKTYEHNAALLTDITFSSTTTASTLSFDAATALDVAVISTNTAISVFKVDPTTAFATKKYVLFGIGSPCTLVGPDKAMLEAPTHYGTDASQNPKDFYQRYAVCFQIDSSVTPNIATFVGSAAITGEGLTATDENVKQYWRNN